MDSVSIRNSISIPLKQFSKPVELITFHGLSDDKEHIALCVGNLDRKRAPLVRIHSECITGDVFHSLKCDCGEQLSEAMNLLDRKSGILLYLRQEGRGIGLYNKIDAYQLQNSGMDTYQANEHLGFKKDGRDFKVAAEILQAMNIKEINLLTNNPEKIKQLIKYGIIINETINTKTFKNKFNKEYLLSKKEKTYHKLDI